MIDNWKEVYILPNGNLTSPDLFHSIWGTEDAFGTKDNPKGTILQFDNNKTIVIGNGLFTISNPGEWNANCFGINKRSTFININSNSIFSSLKNVTVNNNDEDPILLGGGFNRGHSGANVIYKRKLNYYNSLSLYNCLITNKIINKNNAIGIFINNTVTENVFSNINIDKFLNCSVLHNCQISISSALPAKYSAFSNCTFKIGEEDSFTPLAGNTAKEKKADYISRCATQSITTTGIENFYVFSDNSLDDYYRVIKGSEIDLFGVEKGIYFGYEQPESGGIPIKEAITPNSFNNKEGISKGISVSDNLITIADDANIANGVTKQSTLLVFDSIKSIDSLALEYNLPDSVIASTTRNLKKIDIATEKIATATNYLVSSKDANNATVQYSGVTYSSDKNENAYIFRGTSEADTLQSTSNNAIIYKVLDYVNTPSIGVRTTNQATRLDVKSGDIRNGYWYYIEKGSINYNGNTYPERSSFLATSEKTFTDLGDAIVDEIFVDDESQNPFVDVFITKPVAAMSSFTKVATGSDGKLVGSAHDEFQMMLNKGYMEASPQGRIIQLKVGITSNIG